MSGELMVGIYNLNWNFERLRLEEGAETTINGVLKYQISEKGLEEINKSYGNLTFHAIEELLHYRIMDALFRTMRETSGSDLLQQKDIVQNRTRVVVRNSLQEMGLEYVDFVLTHIWIWGREDLEELKQMEDKS
ncbi:MAG: hypothetical protein ACFFBD_01360 [Candidatus Hodarchaeota archaeon]